MGMTPAQASAPGPGPRQPGARAAIAWFAVALAGSAVLGLLAGLIWSEVAPRALLQEVSPGTAEFVNVETSAFIVADGWFCLISAAAGLITGLLGYRFLLTARTGARAAEGVRAAAAAGLILGGIAGAFVMLWLGEQIGLSGYDQHLGSSPTARCSPDRSPSAPRARWRSGRWSPRSSSWSPNGAPAAPPPPAPMIPPPLTTEQRRPRHARHPRHAAVQHADGSATGLRSS